MLDLHAWLTAKIDQAKERIDRNSPDVVLFYEGQLSFATELLLLIESHERAKASMEAVGEGNKSGS